MSSLQFYMFHVPCIYQMYLVIFYTHIYDTLLTMNQKLYNFFLIVDWFWNNIAVISFLFSPPEDGDISGRNMVVVTA